MLRRLAQGTRIISKTGTRLNKPALRLFCRQQPLTPKRAPNIIEIWSERVRGVINAWLQTPVSLGVAEKSWIFGSRVGPQHFHVPLEKLQLAEMIERTKKGGAALVQGGFRSGKTSHLKACKSAISDRFIPIEIAFRPSLFETSFWTWISKEIQISVPSLPPFTCEQEFIELFSNKSSFRWEKKVVFLFDEFQILSKPAAVDQKTTLLSALKYLMDESQVQGLLAFGTFSTAKLAMAQKQTLSVDNEFSPIPYENTIFIRPLPKNEVKILFNEWATQRQVTIVDEVHDLIAENTGCYAGLVGFLGNQMNGLTDATLPIGTEITVSFWLSHCYARLARQLLTTDQFSRVVWAIQNNPHLQKCVREVIIPFPSPYLVRSDEEYLNFWTLADYGLLLQVPEDEKAFKLCAPVLYQVLLEECYPLKMKTDFKPEFLNDFEKLLDFALQNFSSENLSQSICWNKTTQFPSEYVLQAELFAVIREAFRSAPPAPSGPWTIVVEAKQSGRRRSDILVQDGRRILIELKSARDYVDEELLRGHIQQVADYARELSCDDVVLLNITKPSSNPVSLPKFITNDGPKKATVRVRVIQVAFSKDFLQTHYF